MSGNHGKKLALVFGGSRGIGAACVEALAARAFRRRIHLRERSRRRSSPSRLSRDIREPQQWHERLREHCKARLRQASRLRRGQCRHQRAAGPGVAVRHGELPQAGRGEHRRRVQRPARSGAARRRRRLDHRDHHLAWCGMPCRASDPTPATQGRRRMHGALDGEGARAAQGARQRRRAGARGHRPVPRRQDRGSEAALGGDEPLQPHRHAGRSRRRSSRSSPPTRRRGSTARSCSPTAA